MKYVVTFLLCAFSAAALAQECRIEYQRADNMWAHLGRPDGALGTETLTLKPGERKVLITDWKYEKQKNDGTNYYGSHVRIMRNAGQQPVEVVVVPGAMGAMPRLVNRVDGNRGVGTLKPGQSEPLQVDLAEAFCPVAATTATPAQPGITPPTGLMARQNSPHDIVLNWQPVPNAREYRVYVSPPPQPHLQGKPAVLSGSGRHFVITIPRSNPPPAYSASIEAVGQDGSVSQRVPFPTVPVQVAGGGGPATGPSGSPSTPASPGGQQCPPGQFVTGISASGQITCAAPR
ncbi:MAG TPA: hypothetical protein VFK84_02865 [Burkholderiales bacterium]|nr:hypothetical protein [Burkholderiales bacterium]